jgi:transitional endoplasmic reticulum ATPase
VLSKVVGESEKAVSSLFWKARQAAPCILFLDQIEFLAAERSQDPSSERTAHRVLSTLLVGKNSLPPVFFCSKSQVY